ncbi:hypothetical protein [Halomonas sp.]|uniref:hypothetical protein n=1 Tax=Halomonas sp. TaxID=1486246 RepID=UPI003850BA32
MHDALDGKFLAHGVTALGSARLEALEKYGIIEKESAAGLDAHQFWRIAGIVLSWLTLTQKKNEGSTQVAEKSAERGGALAISWMGLHLTLLRKGNNSMKKWMASGVSAALLVTAMNAQAFDQRVTVSKDDSASATRSDASA